MPRPAALLGAAGTAALLLTLAAVYVVTLPTGCGCPRVPANVLMLGDDGMVRSAHGVTYGGVRMLVDGADQALVGRAPEAGEWAALRGAAYVGPSEAPLAGDRVLLPAWRDGALLRIVDAEANGVVFTRAAP